ncbi:hypothetical protein C1T30_43915, partial [Bacillus sp. MBGLi97]
LLILLTPTLNYTNNNTTTTQQKDNTTPKINPTVKLPKIQKILNKIKSQISDDTNENQLNQLNKIALKLSSNTKTLS